MSLSQHHKWIVLFLFAAGNRRKKYNEPVTGKTRLVKELFLLREVGKIKNMYEFFPDNYGPSSEELLTDLNLLIQDDFVQTQPHPYGTQYFLTPKGIKKAQELITEEIKMKIENIKRNYNEMPLNKLLVYVYTAFPKYTVKSIIKNQVGEF